MIFDTLNSMGIPYLVHKYRVVSLIDKGDDRYYYEIFAQSDDRLKRLGFLVERDICRWNALYMFRPLSTREIKIFRLRNSSPPRMAFEDGGAIWEFNGSIRLIRKKRERDKMGRYI